jgi:hypothetical protein
VYVGPTPPFTATAVNEVAVPSQTVSPGDAVIVTDGVTDGVIVIEAVPVILLVQPVVVFVAITE